MQIHALSCLGEVTVLSNSDIGNRGLKSLKLFIFVQVKERLVFVSSATFLMSSLQVEKHE